MTTPMNVFEELAIQYGDIDVNDPDAVNRFFETEVYKLPEEARLDIVKALFSCKDKSPNLGVAQDFRDDENVPLPDPANYESLNEQRSKKSARLITFLEKYLKSV